MVIKEIECPICGNNTIVNNTYEVQKCKFCRRPLKINFKRKDKANGKGRWLVDVEPMNLDEYNSKYNTGYAGRNGENKR